jgi:trk system potassium uptake protein TrkA
MRIVILGCGRTGACLAGRLVAQGHEVTVVDKNSMALGRLGSDFPGQLVVGTGVDEDVLCKAGIEQADACVAVMDEDNTNITAAQVVKEIFGVRRVICRIYDPSRELIYRELGLETICPTIWAVDKIQERVAS